MIRAILRYVQNTLVLSSALLVILAWQRMQSFDYQHNHLATNHFSNQESDPSGEAAFDHPLEHRGFLGRQFSVGLFRFVFPRLDHVVTAMPMKQEPHGGSEAKPSDESLKETVVFLVDIASCDPHWIDAAAVLQHSACIYSNSRHSVELHAMLSGNLLPACGETLRSLGYQIVDRGEIHLPESLEKYRSDPCMRDDYRIELHAMQLQVDVVLQIPLPSLVLPIQASEVVQETSTAKEQSKSKEGHGTAVHILRSKAESLNNLVKRIAGTCSDRKPMDGSDSPAATFPSRKSCGSSCNLVPFKVSTFSECPMPWDCAKEQEATKQNSLQCRTLLDKWFLTRHRFEQKQSSQDLIDKFNASSYSDQYCLKVGPEGYRPMQTKKSLS